MAKEQNQNEIWKKIPGEWDAQYEISPEGVIRYWWSSKATHSKAKYDIVRNGLRFPTIRYQNVGGNSFYYTCILRIGGKKKMFYVHRLLALTFIPNPDNKPQVNHIDANTANNSLSNLEWVTCKENINHAWQNGLCQPWNKGSKKSSITNKQAAV